MSDARPYLSACSWLLALAMGACGGDDASQGAAAPDAGGSAGAASGTGELRSSCGSHRGMPRNVRPPIGVGCSGTTETFRPFCERGCERTTDQTLEDCIDELLALQKCRASLTWECDGFGGSQPTSTCAAESGACLECMGGMLCDALGS